MSDVLTFSSDAEKEKALDSKRVEVAEGKAKLYAELLALERAEVVTGGQSTVNTEESA
jgi:hypothetical protein